MEHKTTNISVFANMLRSKIIVGIRRLDDSAVTQLIIRQALRTVTMLGFSPANHFIPKPEGMVDYDIDILFSHSGVMTITGRFTPQELDDIRDDIRSYYRFAQPRISMDDGPTEKKYPSLDVMVGEMGHDLLNITYAGDVGYVRLDEQATIEFDMVWGKPVVENTATQC